MQLLTLKFFFFFLVVFGLSIPLKRYRKVYPWYIFLVSLIFYAAWSFDLLLILFIETAVVYLILFFSQKFKIRLLKNPNFSLILIVVIVALTWLYFKYTGFLIAPLLELFTNLNLKIDEWVASIIAPIGISYFSFRLISASKLITKDKFPLPNFGEFGSFVTFFPQIMSGPIMTLEEFMEDLNNSKKSFSISYVGISIALGLFKKYILSTYLFDFIYDQFKTPEMYGSVDLMIAAVAYSAYIYVDFSGYTDLANGVTSMLGFRRVENFNMPYLSKNVAEFWRRWHMTLGRWLKYHIYIPLGGSRKGLARKYINLMIVMLFSGLWHGVGLNFIIWGGLHGLGIIIGDIAGRVSELLSKKLPSFITTILAPFSNLTAWALTLSFVIFVRILFRAGDLETAGVYYSTMFSPTTTVVTMLSQWREITFMLIAYLMAMTEVPVRNTLEKIFDKLPIIFLIVFLFAFLILTDALSLSTLPPFLYFKF